MPIYEYECKRCGQRIEAFRSFSDRPLEQHEGCGGELQKLFFPAGIIFKGSGFYTTDSRPKKKEREKDEAKADSKPSPKKRDSSQDD
ncbi:MAG: FmdB family zinc ribbon protein [Acidimicrobiia bacterium]